MGGQIDPPQKKVPLKSPALLGLRKKNLITSISCLVNTKENLNFELLLHYISSCPSSYLNTNLITLASLSLTSSLFSLSLNEEDLSKSKYLKDFCFKNTFKNEIRNRFLCTPKN